jgi:alanine dehydrogenase
MKWTSQVINSIGIRRETKDKTQCRAPLSPVHVRELVRRHGTKVFVEPWSRRVFADAEYKKAGAVLTADLSKCNIIFGVKEIDPALMYDRKPYCFFSHTIKGQAYNMPMLQHIVDHKITLFDYELVKGEDGKRLIFFGDFAGYAGMLDSLWALGRRLDWEGIDNQFTRVRYASKYDRLRDAQEDLEEIGERIWRNGLPGELVPFICAFTGNGRVATAAKELFDLFPTVEIEPENLMKFIRLGRFSDRVLYTVKFRKSDMFQHRKPGLHFDATHFHRHPELYVNLFEEYVPYLTMVVNGIYWEPGFPRLLTKKFMKAFYRNNPHPSLRVIGDITCDIDGSIELTVKETDSTNPVYVYEPLSGRVRDGWEGRGPVILAVDKLPAELPQEASESFGNALIPFVPELAVAQFSKPFNRLAIPDEFKNAMIVHRGKLRRRFSYLKKSLIE